MFFSYAIHWIDNGLELSKTTQMSILFLCFAPSFDKLQTHTKQMKRDGSFISSNRTPLFLQIYLKMQRRKEKKKDNRNMFI